MFMMIEKHRTEYKLIDQAINELTQVMLRIETLEASVEEGHIIEEELRNREMMCRKAIEHLPHRVFMKDVNHTYVFCNAAYSHDFNITPDEISGKSDSDFFSKELAAKMVTEESEILRSGVTREMEEPYVVSGQELTVLATKTPVRNDNGDIIGLQVVLQDITDEKRRTESLALQLKDLEDLLVQEEAKNGALKMDLEKMTVQRNHLETEIKELQENGEKQTASRDAMIEKLKKDLLRETTERKDAVALLQKSFTQIQDLMNSVQHLMGPPSSEDQ